MLAKVYSAAIIGIDTQLVEVEVDVQHSGLPSFNMVGLLETAVKEARDRVTSAISNSGYKLASRRTVVNLAPGHVKKSGVHFDLPIAIGMLIAWGICRPASEKRILFAGELSLSGKILPISGALLMAIAARDGRLDEIIVPTANVAEAEFVAGLKVIGLDSLAACVAFLNDGTTPLRSTAVIVSTPASTLDFAEVRGQPVAKRGLEIAAAGGHHLLMRGPPGSGKTMLAERLPTILPALTQSERLEAMKVLSLHGLLTKGPPAGDERPFRAPHHSSSYAGLIGSGGLRPMPGEISLAHGGVLFLDELGEFRRDVLECLRQPLESGYVQIARAGLHLTYPAQFLLVGAMNPCRCGFLGHPSRPCLCNFSQIQTYRRKISGPLLDRIDIHLELEPVPHALLMTEPMAEHSAAIRERVLAARARQAKRLGATIGVNAQIPARSLKRLAAPSVPALSLLEDAATKLALSARAVHRVLRLARTIADLEASDRIEPSHVAEALQFRPAESLNN